MRAGRGGLCKLAALAAGLAVGTAVLTGCPERSFSNHLTSMAVLPADVAPYHQMTERVTGDYVTQAFARTTFRLVGTGSTTRLLAGPRNQDLYRRFKDQAKTGPEVALNISQYLADVVNAQGLVFPQLAVSQVGPYEGRVALTISIFDRYTGQRIWRNRREKGFVGQLGDPGFLKVVREMADEIVAHVPEPPEEEVQ
ncbi:MAG: hypothetical protein ACK46X_14235 [Candidatus Sericytochromatia bacterium]